MDDELSPNGQAALNGQEPQQEQKKPDYLAILTMSWLKSANNLSAFMGNVGRVGVTNAVNAMTQALKAAQAKNIPGMMQAADIWRDNAQGVVEFNQTRLDEYMNIWSSDEPMQTKLMNFQNVALGKYQDNIAAGLAEQQNVTALGRYLDAMTQMQYEAALTTRMASKAVDVLHQQAGKMSGANGPQGPSPEGDMQTDMMPDAGPEDDDDDEQPAPLPPSFKEQNFTKH